MKSAYSIISIVPRLPPTIDGVGDYAYRLAQQMRQDYGLQTHFVVCEPSWSHIPDLDSFSVSLLKHRSAIDLYSLLRQQSSFIVLLHYVGYGYAKRGCPIWLIDALTQWKNEFPNTRLITMFHEIAASGPFWTSAFWTSGLQKGLAQRLGRVSDRILTSKQSYAHILYNYANKQCSNIPTLPVFSTIGEPKTPSNLSKRKLHLVVFGGSSKRTRVYKESYEKLSQACNYLAITQIFDIGPPIQDIPGHVDNIPVVAMGSLPSVQVSSILSEVIAGFFNYPLDFLAKSTIFAAYAAYRVLPVSAQMTSHHEDDLLAGQHYLTPEHYSTKRQSKISLQSIADNAHMWYGTHNLSVQASTYHKLLSEQ